MDNDRADKLENKMDKIADNISDIKVTLGEQHISLVEHMRRTAIIESKLEPVITHVHRIQGALKLITVITAIVALIEAVLHLVKA